MTTTTTTLAAKCCSHLLIRAGPARQSESVINKHLSLSFCCDLSPPENQIETGVRPRMETDDINMMDMGVVIGYRGVYSRSCGSQISRLGGRGPVAKSACTQVRKKDTSVSLR